MPQHSHSPIAFRLHALALCAAAACAAPVHAQVVAAAGGLKEVVISGTRNEQNPDDLPMSIDVINSKGIEEKQIRDIRDVARDLPNVTVSRAPARFGPISGAVGRDGNAGFNIRGLEGNRVLMLVDGLRAPRSYVFSANSFGRDYMDIGLIQRVEVIRGATSALYGSDGMGGLVNFITSDPSNFLTGGKSIGGRVTLGYEGDLNGKTVGASVAGKASDSLQWLISGSTNRSDGLENMGTNNALNASRTAPNPEKDRNNAILGKLVFNPGGGQKHVVTLEHVDKKQTYNLLTSVSLPTFVPTATSDRVIGANSFTDSDRNRATWVGDFQLGLVAADKIKATVSYQQAKSREYAFENRQTLVDRVRDTSYNEKTLQTNLQADKTISNPGGWAQKIVYGIDYARADIKNLQTGIAPPAGETFPLKRFPDTKETSTALYLQDEFISNAWSITPGVRFDRFSIDANPAGFSPPATTPAASISGSATSPKLGVLFRATPQWSVYGNYAAGFRAPNAGQVNGFFENTVQGYKTISNPNLKPEKSQNFELGARGRLDQLTLDFAAFTGRYKDFIEDNRQVSGTGAPGNPIVFQSVNINSVKISGFEVKGDMNWGRVAGGLLSTPFSYGQAKGTNTRTGAPINSINPARLTAGVKYDAAVWGVRLDMTHREAKKREDTDLVLSGPPPSTQFLTPSATTFDLTGQWRFTKDLRLNAGIYNLTDKKYFNWTDVRGQSATSTTIDSFTQPGRYVRVSLVADF